MAASGSAAQVTLESFDMQRNRKLIVNCRLRGSKQKSGSSSSSIVAAERDMLMLAECEQRRIGKELRERVCQDLSGLVLLANAALRDVDEDDRTDIAELAAIAQQSLKHARGLARSLDPIASLPDGLSSALQQLAMDTADATAAACAYREPRPVHIHDVLVAVQIYRIAQDAVWHAARVRQSRNIRIELLQDSNGIELRVCDNGGSAARDRCAARMMAHRARLIDATLSCHSRSNGTVAPRIVCRLPRPKLHARRLL
jgi:signal transduction histidine kinase